MFKRICFYASFITGQILNEPEICNFICKKKSSNKKLTGMLSNMIPISQHWYTSPIKMLQKDGIFRF